MTKKMKMMKMMMKKTLIQGVLHLVWETSIMKIILSPTRADQIKKRRILLLYDWVTSMKINQGVVILPSMSPVRTS